MNKILAVVACVLSLAVGCTEKTTEVTAAPAAPAACATTVPEATRLIDHAVDAVYPALVRVGVIMTSPADGRMQKMMGSGSGAIISDDGYVITNHHVAGRAERMVCRLSDRQEIEATLVGTDPMCDIAILKLKLDQLKDPKKPLPVAKFGDSSLLRVGDTVLAMGSPAGLSQSVTVGVVSNTEMILPWGGLEQEGEAVGMLVRWIGHDAIIFHGNSGGPLVNLKGEIVGINEIGIASIGGAIPSNIAKQVAESLIKSGKVTRSWTGLETQTVLKTDKGTSGVLIASIVADSPAAKAGLQSGDVITQYAGEPVSATVAEELPLFNQLMLSQPVGKTVKIVYRRDGKTSETSLTTVDREKALGRDEELKSWGMTAREFTMFSAMELQRDRSGVQIETIRPGGPCSEAKPALQPGDVITEVGGVKISSLEDLRKLSSSLTKDSTRMVEVLTGFERGTRKYLTVVHIGKEPEKNEASQARKPWMGISTQVLTADLAKALKIGDKTGVRVTQVMPGTNIDKAGLKVGDIILKFDGDVVAARQVEDEEVFYNMVRRHKIGQEVALDILRGGEAKKLTVKLQEPPTPISELKQYRNDDFEFAARDMSFVDKTDRKLEAQTQGVLVDRVEATGWASLGGLASGDILKTVDGKPVGNIEQLKKLLADARQQKPQRMVFTIQRGIHTRFLELTPSWEK